MPSFIKIYQLMVIIRILQSFLSNVQLMESTVRVQKRKRISREPNGLQTDT